MRLRLGYGITAYRRYLNTINLSLRHITRSSNEPLQIPPLPHQRNITVLTFPDVRVLRLLGVRYAIMRHADYPIGPVRATEAAHGIRLDLLELPNPNLATFSPTSVSVRQGLASALSFVADPSVDLSRAAVTTSAVPGPLVPLQSSSLSTEDGDLHVTANSAGRSLVVVPLEFSHCVELSEQRLGLSTPAAQMIRVDANLTGIVFEHSLDATLAFHFGPLHSPMCRWQDYQELKALTRGGSYTS